jgi:hypothetical protein
MDAVELHYGSELVTIEKDNGIQNERCNQPRSRRRHQLHMHVAEYCMNTSPVYVAPLDVSKTCSWPRNALETDGAFARVLLGLSAFYVETVAIRWPEEENHAHSE